MTTHLTHTLQRLIHQAQMPQVAFRLVKVQTSAPRTSSARRPRARSIVASSGPNEKRT